VIYLVNYFGRPARADLNAEAGGRPAASFFGTFFCLQLHDIMIPNKQAEGKVELPPDAELIALAEKYITAEQKYCDKNRAFDRMYGHLSGREKKLPRGYRKAEREQDQAEKAYRRIEEITAETRATTPEGMLAKVRCAAPACPLLRDERTKLRRTPNFRF
jgi:hypothetical protein